MQRNGAGDYTVHADTTLDGKPVTGTFRIVRDDEADKVAGKSLWPITGKVGGVEIKDGAAWLVLDAATSLGGSRRILDVMCRTGFRTRDGIPHPIAGCNAFA